MQDGLGYTGQVIREEFKARLRNFLIVVISVGRNSSLYNNSKSPLIMFYYSWCTTRAC